MAVEAPVGAAVPVVIDTGPDGALCYHEAAPPGGVPLEWDGLGYDYVVTNPACCPPGYSVVGLLAGAVVCLVSP
jgi:hypothetical protein